MDLTARLHPRLLVLLVLLLLPSSTSVLALERPAWQQPTVPVLLISEFTYDPPGLDEEREWVEVANVSDSPLALDQYKIGDEEQRGGGEGMLRFPLRSEIAPGDAAIIAQTAAGFRALYGFSPDFEIKDSDPNIPDMLAESEWADGQFALANDGDEILLLDAQDRVIDALNYGDRTIYFTPAIQLVRSGQSIERGPLPCDTNSAVDWRPATPSPTIPAADGECRQPPDQGDEDPGRLRPIGEIQGAADVSPFIGRDVSFQGIVTGFHEDQNAAGIIYYTLFVQDAPGQEDGDTSTSDAVAVFFGRLRLPYQIGDLISVKGQVIEYYGLTEIEDSDLQTELISPAVPLPPQETLQLPQNLSQAPVYLEAREGMLVTAPGPLPVVGPTHSGCGFDLDLNPSSPRPMRNSELEQIFPPLLVMSQSDVDCSDLPALKTGDLVSGVSGPLTYNFEQYKVVQQQNDALQVDPIPLKPLPALPQAAEDQFSVATLNLDNLLRSLATQQDQEQNGQTANHLEIKMRKLSAAIAGILGCPTLIGVQEVETEALLSELANQTAEQCGFTYQVSHKDSADGRGIDVALLSNPRRVEIDSIELHQVCSTLETGVADATVHCAAGEDPLFSRPPLQVFMQVDGEPLAIIVNHFKSKRGGVAETAPRRLLQAQHVHTIVKRHLNQDPRAAVVLLGDFNDYYHSPVWAELQRDGVLIDVLGQIPDTERYSYIFNGAAQLIDGILVSPALAHRVAAVTIPHSNADYPITFAFDDSDAILPYRVSDHDPILLKLKTALSIQPTAAATADQAAPVEAAPTPSRVAPTSQPTPRPVTEPAASPTAVTFPDNLSSPIVFIAIAGILLALIFAFIVKQ